MTVPSTPPLVPGSTAGCSRGRRVTMASAPLHSNRAPDAAAPPCVREASGHDALPDWLPELVTRSPCFITALRVHAVKHKCVVYCPIRLLFCCASRAGRADGASGDVPLGAGSGIGRFSEELLIGTRSRCLLPLPGLSSSLAFEVGGALLGAMAESTPDTVWTVITSTFALPNGPYTIPFEEIIKAQTLFTIGKCCSWFQQHGTSPPWKSGVLLLWTVV